MEMTIDELKAEMRRGARVILQVRHAERPKMAPDDPTFGDALHLTREGRRTARLLGEALAEFAGDAGFVSSPLTRTRETAALVAEGMGLGGVSIPVDARIGNESFFYDDPAVVLKVFEEMDFFKACFEYFDKGTLRGFRNLHSSADEYEQWLDEQAAGRKFFVAVTHDCYIAAFLAARGAYGPFSRRNWVRFLDGCATLTYPDGSRRHALVRAGLSHGICGVRPTKGVVFDFGGVMTTSTMPERVRACTARLGIDWDVLEGGFAHYRRLMDADFMTMEEMYDLIWADAGLELSAETRAQIVAEDHASFLEGSRNLETLEWMKTLKSQGLKIGILSNMSTDMERRFRATYADFIALADAMVISGEERMFKPQKRIYDLMRDRLGLHSDELCFIDDAEGNCEGARLCGWHAIRFENAGQAERDFRERFG